MLDIKEIKPYKQRGMTCAISCMLMVLEYYKIIPEANWIYEKKYYKSYHSKYMEGTPFSAIAWHFVKNNLNVEIIHSEKNMFNNLSHFLPDDSFNDAMREYSNYLEDAIKRGAKVINGCDITCDSIKKKLNEDKLVILAGQTYGSLHAILICGYNEDKFIVCDPLYKQKQEKTDEEISEFMDTPLGKWYIAVSNKE